MHAEGQPEEFIDAAIKANLSQYGIADHAPTLQEPFDDWRMLQKQLPDYLEWIERATIHAKGQIKVRSGLECDWLPNCQSWIKELRTMHSWDYLLSLIHI